MSKRRENLKDIIRLIGMLVMDWLLYRNGDKEQFIDFIFMLILIFWVIPHLATLIIFGKSKGYDGTFLIDENDPTDVKMKISMDTDFDIIAESDNILLKVDHRGSNMDYDERSDDNV